MFSRPWPQLHVFPRLGSVSYFPALGIGYIFSRFWHQFHIFLRLAPVTIHVSPRLAPVNTCFPTLATGYVFVRALYSLSLFLRFPRAAFFRLEFLSVLRALTLILANHSQLNYYYRNCHYSSHWFRADHGLGRKSHRGSLRGDRSFRWSVHA